MQIKKRGKRAQITIFVILALIIIVSIILIVGFRVQKKNEITSKININSEVQSCLKDALVSAEKKIIPLGGIIEKGKDNSVLYEKKNISYYCYTDKEGELCTNKHPMLKEDIEEQIKLLVEPELENCFNEIKSQLENYNYQEEETNLTIEIQVDGISGEIIKPITYTKSEETISLKVFRSKISSPLFNFIVLSSEIVNQELDCDCGEESCNADIVKLSLANPNFEIIKPIYSGTGIEVYTIKELDTTKKLNFAIRNCFK